ncbi:MAG: type II toxin-antitoxin system Phd/YefM family antitoxin [Spirochaetia bacterium]
MLLETKQMIAVTQLQRELTKKIREISETGEPLYILKNNKMEAVILPFEEYEHLHQLEELVEQIEIKDMLETRLKKYNPAENIPWEELRDNE